MAVKKYQAIGFGAYEGIWFDEVRVEFRNGLFETSSKAVQDRIENSEYYKQMLITDLNMDEKPKKSTKKTPTVEGVITTEQ
jgi:hypothetical protein